MRCLLLSGLLLGILTTSGNAQADIKDSGIHIWLIGGQGGLQFPGGNLSERFGMNAVVGGGVYYKSATNWLFGIDYNFMFGSAVKEKPVDRVAAENGYLINGNGEYQIMKIYERGNMPMFRFGKVLPLFGPNPNSGLLIRGGAGVLVHKIKYYFTGSAPPQLAEEYIKGYDRLTGGPAFAQSIGYIHLSNRNRVNFSASFEIIEGFTRSLRSWDFATNRYDDRRRLDLLYGISLQWYFPIYKQAADDDFYY
ncbi:MAG: hypothetical protein M3Q97_03370 [Bacteroidota bacterium]|nr:hypothetical protein [Bacteroidota bacterium]